MKRTIENCSIKKKCVKCGIGEPDVKNGYCLGYCCGENDDEPIDACKKCKYYEIKDDD